MYKNENMFSVELEEKFSENIMQAFYKGAEIVFVTEAGKFAGGITKGDIQRYFKNGSGNIELSSFINTQMRRVIFLNEKQVFSDAAEIFEKY